MHTRVLLVRHGSYGFLDQGLGGRDGYGLSAQGRDEAETVAHRLIPYRPAAIVASPVRRAMETAEIVACRLGLVAQADAAFAEIDFAGWSGKRFDDLHSDPAWQAWNSFRSTAGVPGGETMLEAQARAIAGLLRYVALYPGGEFVVVSHSDVIKAMLAHFLGTPLDLMRRIEISPGSLSEVLLYRADAKILAVNIRT